MNEFTTPQPPPPPPAAPQPVLRPLPQVIVCPYAGQVPPKKKKHWVLWTLFILFCLAVILLPCLLIVGVIFAAMDESASLTSSVVMDGSETEEIAIINIKGVIQIEDHRGYASADRICHLLKALQKMDNPPKAIILDMDTPGGEVTAGDEIHSQIQECRKQGIKVVTCIRSLGASGGYYVASGTDWIVANRISLTGSIGVILKSYNVQGLAGKLGIAPVVIKSGAMKDIMSSTRPMTDSEKKLLQDEINETFLEFQKIVVAGRSKYYKDLATLQKQDFLDGRVLSGAQAKKLNLVDELGNLDTAIRAARKLSGCGNAKVVRYSYVPGFLEQLQSMEISRYLLPKSVAPAFELQPGKLYFLMQ